MKDIRPIFRNLSLLFLLTACSTTIQEQLANEQIREIMQAQEDAWNAGNLEQFMQGYWQSDSLCFIGSKGLTYGWQQTLDNYHQSYPDRDAMGTLTFELERVEQLSETAAYVIGSWRLDRKEDVLQGYYTLLWKKMDGAWVIVADHSS